HVKAYMQRGFDLHRQASAAAEDFLQRKLLELKDRVERSEAALNSYRSQRGIVEFSLRDTGGVMTTRLNDLNAALTRAETARITLAAQEQLIQKGDYESLSRVVNSSLIQKMKEDVATLRERYASMNNRFHPGYHPLDDLGARLLE